RMFAVGLLVFSAASAAGALSPNVGTLIAARTVQGAGAAIVMPLTLTLISAAFPVEKRGAAIGLWGGIAGLAVAAGPVVGGGVVDGINWHWIFWLNVPLGLVLIPLALFRHRGFSAANGVSFFMYAGLFGTLFLMAQYFQTALGYSPLQAGIRLLPWTATPMVIAPIAGSLADRFGNRPFMVVGLA